MRSFQRKKSPPEPKRRRASHNQPSRIKLLVGVASDPDKRPRIVAVWLVRVADVEGLGRLTSEDLDPIGQVADERLRIDAGLATGLDVSGVSATGCLALLGRDRADAFLFGCCDLVFFAHMFNPGGSGSSIGAGHNP